MFSGGAAAPSAPLVPATRGSTMDSYRLHLCTVSATSQKIQVCLTQHPHLVTRPEAPGSTLLAGSHREVEISH